MKFIVSTKPLSDGLNLGVLNANVSKFYQKSTLAQITADDKTLKINLEAASIVSEIVLKGQGDSPESSHIFVDCMLLKSLISTIDTATVTFEFAESGLIIHSGKSKFTLPKMIDDDVEISLKSPSSDFDENNLIEIKKADWKFTKDYQMFAISMSLIYPVYTKVFIGENGEVLVGDFDNSLFTYSNKSNLGKTCLLSDTVINLLTSLPEDSKLTNLGDSYLIKVSTDSFDFSAEFTPSYENEDGVGSYNSNIILDLMSPSEDITVPPVEVDVTSINKALSQSVLLSNSSENVITIEMSKDNMHIVDNSIDCNVPIKGETIDYSVTFKTSILKSVIANAPDEKVFISPMFREDVITGIRFKFKELTVVLAGVE